MTTYVLSQHRTCWHVHRYGEHVTSAASKLPTEKDALEIALRKAKQERPSQVLRVTMQGNSTVIARFGKPAKKHD